MMLRIISILICLCISCLSAQAQVQRGIVQALKRQAYEDFALKANTAVETAWLHNIDLATYKRLTADFSFRAPHALNTAYRTLPALPVKSTDKKWIYSNVYFHNVFSTPEKLFLLKHQAPLVNLGKIAFVYDRNDALFAHINTKKSFTEQDINAFTEHQNRLDNLFVSLDVYYKNYEPELFASPLFSEQEIKNMLLKDAVQPAAYAFHPSEFEKFAALPDLAAQQTWVAEQKQVSTETLNFMQTKGASYFEEKDFMHYYMHKVRLNYLETLENVLKNSTQKRASLLMRYKLPLNGLSQPATDAERLGFLQFMQDTKPTPENAKELETQKKLYAHYAAAEVLEAPYEVALKGDYFAPELLGQKTGQRLRQLSPQETLDELLPKIYELESQMQLMREVFKPENMSFYKCYYTLYTEIQIYKTLVARANVLLSH